ncbi:MAG: branched chain amino acid aminotransferase [Hydrogenophilales bacterium CG_4_9_14_3_um_filter_59_35]|nr:MAG: branched chain amino acid aminotransferase [Hydrogenophilales bacterium CG18_big_fil_WC_8_21_14_2_50_58_12]PIY00834.1 MAG: branched chain amino acid aminotransferase [Hydrogenophilales bacterium CG_4_10_14_3_um_filter_58_23]PJB07851.1 MAG: branched chain amino acid aminotransferase [Hydrogenophilales bacterium CG_4_9_14_3_um_filter_59_35]
MKVWFDGSIAAVGDTRVSCLAHTLHYGTGVFEGIRAYGVEDGRTVFRLREHVERLFNSARSLRMEIPFSPDEIENAIQGVLSENGLRDAYIRPLVFFEQGGMGLDVGAHPRNPVRTLIAAWKWDSYFSTSEWGDGISARLGDWKRVFPHPSVNKAKAVGFYASSYLAHMEAKSYGYQEAILIDEDGNLAEASASNLFLVQDGTLFTPTTCAILPGITRDTVITIARDLGLKVNEEHIPQGRIFLADEVFLTGTASEVVPVTQINGQQVGSGKAGPVTKRISDTYRLVVRNAYPFSGEGSERVAHWHPMTQEA